MDLLLKLPMKKPSAMTRLKKAIGIPILWDAIYDLKKVHTKTLMKWRARAYRNDGMYNPAEDDGPSIPLRAMLEELNTRPHVPNKQEAKIIRQQKAKQKKHK